MNAIESQGGTSECGGFILDIVLEDSKDQCTQKQFWHPIVQNHVLLYKRFGCCPLYHIAYHCVPPGKNIGLYGVGNEDVVFESMNDEVSQVLCHIIFPL